jgi:hypothetical protein
MQTELNFYVCAKRVKFKFNFIFLLTSDVLHVPEWHTCPDYLTSYDCIPGQPNPRAKTSLKTWNPMAGERMFCMIQAPRRFVVNRQTAKLRQNRSYPLRISLLRKESQRSNCIPKTRLPCHTHILHLHLHLGVMGEVKPGGLFEYTCRSSGGLKEI